MSFDLFGPEITDDDVDALLSLRAGCLITGSCFSDDIAIVPNETVRIYPNAVCYTPQEARYILTLSHEEAMKLHKMKKAFGGHVKGIE